MEKRILDCIDSPVNLKVLSDDDLAILADEIRHEIIDVTSRTGGHVASSLGAVETILAVHSLIDSPEDRFLFDVGHQSYAHMLVTGRLKEFSTLRQFHGLSGFPKPDKNAHDVHPSGHASDSLSVACGLAHARDLRGSHEKIVALIGDASLAGGMALEALNDIGQARTPLVIILNDNEMSISRPVGALAKHLGMVRTKKQYRQGRDDMQDFIERSLGRPGKALVDLGRNAKESLKQFVIPDAMMFEQLGIVCTPPVDGHNIPELKRAISAALQAQCPVLVHVVTRKGYGYAPAEHEPSRFHGTGPYDVATGKPLKKDVNNLTFTQAFSKALIQEAEKDSRIVAITAAMIDGTGLRPFADRFPKRCFDVGIAEEHAVGMASGLAFGGMKPVVALYSTFAQRAIDQMIINNALPQADVVFAIDRAGLVGDDGPTHHGMFDLSYLRMIPGMQVLAPSDEAELAHALHTALSLKGPCALRYPRGEAPGAAIPLHPQELEPGVSRLVREGSDCAILAFGRMVAIAQEAAELLAQKNIGCRVVDMRWVKPLDEDAVLSAAECGLVVTLEDNVVSGGAGQGVVSALSDHCVHVDTLVLGLPDGFVEQGSVSKLFEELGLDAEGVAHSIQNALR
ncbi:MAG: 1-deoxy-D-xylulose-5-phosphate synthase [Coriobacteriia bacterium]|nr:1-deoxy-D-xylulose-5-phosphate synthase [Coriobacteriia bacterium]